MADFSGKYQYLERDGHVLLEGACRVQFDAQTFVLTPENDAPIACDLGDFDCVAAADWEIRLALFTGRSMVLRQFAKAYETLAQGLLEAHRERSVRCLLLEDMEEVARFVCQFELSVPGAATRAGPAELRVYQTNLAVLASTSVPFQWRLADVDSVRFDAANYTVILESGNSQLKISRLAKRTEEFAQCVRNAISAVATSGAQALHAAFPFLDPDQLQSVAALLREGGSAPVAQLAAIHPEVPAALAANAVDKDLQPYYDRLLARTPAALLYAGFKLIRPDEDVPSTGPGAVASAPAQDGANAEEAQALYWFFFPLAKQGESKPVNVVAWEANSSGGRATYLFRLLDDAQVPQPANSANPVAAVDAAVRSLNRGLALLNFRRRPIYLSDEELARDPQYHRYAIAARRMPELRALRRNFLGRAIHSSPESWLAQVESIIGKEM